MVTKEVLQEQFQNLGCNADDDEILEKCIEICNILQKDEEQIIELWLAFSATHYENFDPTLQRLEEMLRVELKTKHEEPTIFNESSVSHKETNQYIEDDDILEMYGCKPVDTPKSKRQRISEAQVPDQESNKWTIDDVFSGSSPSITFQQNTPKQFKENGGKILLYFGEKVQNWKNADNIKLLVTKSPSHDHISSDAMYMFELLSDKMETLLSICHDLGIEMCRDWNERKKDDFTYSANARQKSQKPFRTFGRIYCDTKKEGKSSNIIYLESCQNFMGIKEDIFADRLPLLELDLSKVSHYSFFPGQIVAIECTNPTGNTLVTTEVIEGRKIKPFQIPHLSGNVKLVVAAGPFTTFDNLNCEPLWDLMERVAEEEPHVLILIGPFIEYNHPELKNVKSVTFQELFNKIVSTIMDKVKGNCTQVILVASYRDSHHNPIYPTPEYYRPKDLLHADLHLMPDPCMLCIDGLNIGITSVDSVMHLGRTEIAYKPSITDKLSRLANYILTQGCFYPLYPPAKEMSVDTILWKKYAFMDQLPHLLILPSDMRYFCKPINGSVVINPERLNKRTFARIDVKPARNNAWTHERVSCEILKV